MAQIDIPFPKANAKVTQVDGKFQMLRKKTIEKLVHSPKYEVRSRLRSWNGQGRSGVRYRLMTSHLALWTISVV